MDIERIKANGPWLLLKVLVPELIHGWKKRSSGVWVMGHTDDDKYGYTRATVVSVGPGTYEDTKAKTGWVTLRGAVEPGDDVLVRWYLTELNRPSMWDDEHCFIHQKDVLGTYPRVEIAEVA